MKSRSKSWNEAAYSLGSAAVRLISWWAPKLDFAQLTAPLRHNATQMRTGEVGQEKKQTETKQKEALNRVQSWLNVRKVSYCEAPAVKMAAVAWHIEKQTYKYTVHVHVHIASVNQWPRSILEHKFYLLHCKHDVERRSRTQRAAVWCWHTLNQTDRINDNRETADVTWSPWQTGCNCG